MLAYTVLSSTVGGNGKSCTFMTLTLKMYLLTPISISLVFVLYPTMVLNTNPLGLIMPEKSGRQTDKRQLDQQINTQNQVLYSCPLR